MNEILSFLKIFNDYYADVATFSLSLVATIIAGYFYGVYKESKLKEGDAAFFVRNVFYTCGKKYKILAIHEYEISSQANGYKHISQYSRPEQFEKLVQINSFLNFRHKIIPIDRTKLLTIVISRDGKEKWRNINFNKGII